jgi:hypothetical protein
MKYFLLSIAVVASGAIATACQPTNPTASNPEASSTPQAVTSSFDEAMYLFVNPDVKKLIEQGKYKSGLDHYTQVGQTTKKPDGESYESFFTGTDGNDTIEGFGKGEQGKDVVVLSGQPSQYKFEAVDKNLRVSTTQGDLVAIVEGIDKLKVGDVVKEYGMFTMK